MALKHIGRIATNKRRCIVAYRTIPGDAYSALVILTEALPADEHDALMKLVESPAGQQAFELYEVMQRSYLPDGRNMLSGFHSRGQLRKVATNEIEMTPDTINSIALNELNKIIAEQKGVAVEDLAVAAPEGVQAPKPIEEVDPASVYTSDAAPVTTSEDGILTDDVLAAQLRSQADSMFKEAKRLREQAEDLVPTKKKTKKTTESA
jgi:hypothetical protein